MNLVLAKLAGGTKMKEIMEEYQISREDINAVLDYVARF